MNDVAESRVALDFSGSGSFLVADVLRRRAGAPRGDHGTAAEVFQARDTEARARKD